MKLDNFVPSGRPQSGTVIIQLMTKCDVSNSLISEQQYQNSIYLRNLQTHTVNNLLQMLNNVKSSQFLVLKQIFKIIYIMCETFKTVPWILCKIQLIQFERVKIGSHKNWNLGSSLHFSEANLISFVMLSNEKRHCMKFTVD